MTDKNPGGVDYTDPDVLEEILGPACMPGGKLVGVDMKPDLLTKAARLAKEDGLEDAARFVEGDVYALPFDDASFDTVMAQVVFCHLDEPQRALDEFIRVGRPGACIAIFDNAIGGCPMGWESHSQETVADKLRRCERILLAQEGRKKLGRGDWSVGLHIHAWMEARGMRDVDVRINERALWLAPPYASPAQQLTLEQKRALCEDKGFLQMNTRNIAEELRATGADEDYVDGAVTRYQQEHQGWRDALIAGTHASSYGGTFWCTWGFVPPKAAQSR
jgi:SAM-dependent methyltransferase